MGDSSSSCLLAGFNGPLAVCVWTDDGLWTAFFPALCLSATSRFTPETLTEYNENVVITETYTAGNEKVKATIGSGWLSSARFDRGS